MRPSECLGWKVIESLSIFGQHVLPLEWIHGFKLAGTECLKRADTIDTDAVIRIGVTTGLQQLLEFGFFHADPHPGNLFALEDGRMAYIDFGMMDQLDEETKEALVDSVVHLINRDYVEQGLGRDIHTSSPRSDR